MSLKKLIAAAAATLVMGMGTAHAGTYSLVGLKGGPLQNPGSFIATLNSDFADAMASLNFVVQGFYSLDGKNSYQDVLSLTINEGTTSAYTATGSFNLGGGGSSDTSFGSGSASTVTTGVASASDIGWMGGTTTITGLKFNLLKGENTFLFAYSAPGKDNKGGQSLTDEGWGISSAAVTAVPEPETYALMLAGLGLVGTIARRRQAKLAA